MGRSLNLSEWFLESACLGPSPNSAACSGISLNRSPIIRLNSLTSAPTVTQMSILLKVQVWRAGYFSASEHLS